MARTKGKSHAWQQLLPNITRHCPIVSKPWELDQAIDTATAESGRWLALSAVEVQSILSRLAIDADYHAQEAQRLKSERSRANKPLADAIEASLRRIESSFFLVRLYHFLRGRTDSLRTKLQALVQEPDFVAKPSWLRHEQLKKEYQRISANPITEAHTIIAAWTNRLDSLRQIRASREFAGAVVELEVIDQLAQLPDKYVVLNGVELELERSVRFDGEYLRTAQVDHLVIGPTGIFLIETKAWSRAFAASGEGFDPYKQVNRARHLCKCLLNDQFGKHLGWKPYGVVAYSSALPTRPSDCIISAVRIQDIGLFVRQNAQPLSPEQVDQVSRYLALYLPSR